MIHYANFPQNGQICLGQVKCLLQSLKYENSLLGMNLILPFLSLFFTLFCQINFADRELILDLLTACPRSQPAKLVQGELRAEF